MSIPSHDISKAVPVLPAGDLVKTLQYYRDKCQFQTIHYGDVLVVKFGEAEIHFYETVKKQAWAPSECCLLVSNIEDMYAYFIARDLVQPGMQLRETNRRQKEFSLMDINGNRIRFLEQK